MGSNQSMTLQSPRSSLADMSPDEIMGFTSQPRQGPPLERTDRKRHEDSEDCETVGSKCYIERYVDVDYTKLIGEGSYGLVYRATNTLTGEKYAVKMINKKKIPQASLDMISRETFILQGLDHPNVIKYHFTTESDDYINIYTDYYGGGDVFGIIEDFHINECKVYLLFSQMVEAVKYLHSKGIIHRDIKLENFLYNNRKDLHVVIADFGFSVFRHPGDPLLKDFPGTPQYAAPELLKGRPYDGYASDVWALGVCLYTMVTGEYPFESSNKYEFSENVMYAKYDESTIDSPYLKILIKGMLNPERSERSTLDDILNSTWMVKWREYIEKHGNCDSYREPGEM